MKLTILPSVILPVNSQKYTYVSSEVICLIMLDETDVDAVNVTDIRTSHEINLFESFATYQNV